MKPEFSLPCLQESAIERRPEQGEFILISLNLFLAIRSICQRYVN